MGWEYKVVWRFANPEGMETLSNYFISLDKIAAAIRT